MSEKKLETFKIGDTRRPTVRPSTATRAKKAPEASEETSLGFQRIEKMLEDEEPEAVSARINDLLGRLEEFARGARTQREKAAVKKAIIAVERTADLLNYLYQVKDALRQGG